MNFKKSSKNPTVCAHLSEIEAAHKTTRTKAVAILARKLDRSDMTIWGWLSGKPVPTNTLKLIKLMGEQNGI